MTDGVMVVCAWCNAVVSRDLAGDGPDEHVSHGICTECALGFLRKLPKEYLESIAEPDGTVTLFSGCRLDIESGLER